MPFKRETAKGIKYSTSVFDKVTGKQIRILFDTQREAKDAEAKIRSQLLDGTYWKNHTPISTDGVLTLRKFWEQRYQAHARQKYSGRSYESVESHMNAHLLLAFGSTPLVAITRMELDTYANELVKGEFTRRGWVDKDGKKKFKPRSPATANRIMMTLASALRQARKWHLIEVNPMAEWEQFKETPHQKDLLSVDEIVDILERMPIHLRAAVGIAVYAGLRRSEIFQLEWRDIDMDNQTIAVRKQAEDASRSRRAKTVKTKRSERLVDFGPELAALLEQHPRSVNFQGKNVYPLVFPGEEGEKRDNMTKVLVRIGKEIGLRERLSMHQFRHAYCSYMIMANDDINVVSELMGHGSIAMTKRYAHTTTEHRRKAAGQLRYKTGS
tara:strand:+ start:1317 stop:2465 length:1149 start_codon:yes stop_codon:yes gene_type:complete